MKRLRLLRATFVVTSCLFNNAISSSIDPFSQIIITSDSATCKIKQSSQDTKKKSRSPEEFEFVYQTNVCVTLADNSTIKADKLEIIFDGSKNHYKNNVLHNFKKITFLNNVSITSAQRKAVANQAELYLSDKKCTLLGNVKINQTKFKDSDLPIAIESQRADFDFMNNQMKLVGSKATPVSTTIVLAGHPALSYKKDLEKKRLKKTCQK